MSRKKEREEWRDKGRDRQGVKTKETREGNGVITERSQKGK